MKKLIFTILTLASLLVWYSYKDTVLGIEIYENEVKFTTIGKEVELELNEIPSKRTENSIVIFKRNLGDDRIEVQHKFYEKPQFYKENGVWKYIEYKTESRFAYELKHGTRIVFGNIAYAVSGNIIFYPSAGDGYVRYINGANWSAARNALSGNGADKSTSLIYAPYVGKTGTGYFNVYRFYSPFDTSDLPDNYSVSAAQFCVWVDSKADGDNDGDDWINVFKTKQASYYNLVNADFNIATKWETTTAGATAIDIGDISTGGYNCWNFNATGISWISNTSFTPIGLLEGHDDINSAYAGANNTSNHIRIYTSETAGTTKDPYLLVTYSPSVEWLKDYSGRIKVFMPASNVPTSSEGFPYEIVLATTSGYTLQQMQWIFDQMNISNPWQKIQPTTDDGITQMYGEVEEWNTTTKMARLWVSKSSYEPSTTSNAYFYLYYDKNHSPTTTYISKIKEGANGAINVWTTAYFQNVFNFSNTTTDSVNFAASNSVTGNESYSGDEKGFSNSSFNFDGFTYITPGVSPIPTTSIFMNTFALIPPPPGSYTFFDYHSYQAEDPNNTTIRVYYSQGVPEGQICINIGELSGSTTCQSWTTDGLWHQMSVRFRPGDAGATNCVYIDAIEIVCESFYANDTGSSAFTIGSEHDGSNPFLGSMGYFWVKGSVEGDDDEWYKSLYKNFQNNLIEYLPNYKMIHY